MSIRLESGVSFEPAEGQPHCCPTCERPLEGIRAYPLIFIKDVKKLRFPDHINWILWARRKDVVKTAKNEAVTSYLTAFKSAKGTVVKLSSIEHQIIKDDHFENYFRVGDFFVGLVESNTPNVAKIVIATKINVESNSGHDALMENHASIAEVHYEGVLNEPPEDLLKGMIGAGRARS